MPNGGNRINNAQSTFVANINISQKPQTGLFVPSLCSTLDTTAGLQSPNVSPTRNGPSLGLSSRLVVPIKPGVPYIVGSFGKQPRKVNLLALNKISQPIIKQALSRRQMEKPGTRQTSIVAGLVKNTGKDNKHKALEQRTQCGQYIAGYRCSTKLLALRPIFVGNRSIVQTSVAGTLVMREFKGGSHEDGRKTKAIAQIFQKTGTFGERKFRTAFRGFPGTVIILRCVGVLVVVVFIGADAAALGQKVSVVL